MKDFKFTDGQKECINLTEKWYGSLNEQVFEYDGPAGTGKTSIIPEIVKRIGLDMDEEVLAVAYTGKAASNLTLKGIDASSMHSAFMDVLEVPKRDKYGDIIYKNGRKLTTLTFVKKHYLPKHIKLIIIDEGFFVDSFMGKISESFGLPILVTGDKWQLPPINGDSYFLNNPDYSLTEITRQAKESGIIELATRIRLGQEMPDKKCRIKNDVFILPKREITDTILLNTDIILCGKNRTRNYFNKRIRKDILGINSKLPVKGDKIICRHNYWNRLLGGIPLTNGIIGYVIHDVLKDNINIKDSTIRIDFQPDYVEYDYYESLPIDINFFNDDCGTDKTSNIFTKGIKMELGNAITTHLAQGSEFDNVLYWDEYMGDSEFMKRLRYTGVTRAKKILVTAI